MKYTKWQLRYLDLAGDNFQYYALKIIGELERGIQAKDELLVCYRIGGQPKEKTMNALDRFEKFNNPSVRNAKLLN